MANKDHSLDDKIIKAAREEFLEQGFQKASIHKIARNAGITTGALYTRYKNKDALFVSLTEAAINGMKEHAALLREMYYAVEQSRDKEEFLRVMSYERQLYIDLIFQYYDECKLFLCLSDGSSIETMMSQIMKTKADETENFFKRLAKKSVDLNGVKLIMQEQFHFYKQILSEGYTKEETVSCIQLVETFYEAGWRELFEKIM